MKPEVLINYSGGIDSVYAAWKYLSDGENVLLHHCNLKTRFGRHAYEKRSVAKTLKYFKEKGYTNFKYVESGFDYGSIRSMIYDVEVIGFMTGVVLRSRPHSDISRVVVSVNSEDPTGQDLNNFRRVRSNSYAESVSGKKIQWEYPSIRMTKKEIIDAMPRELVRMCWWCRTPAPNGSVCNLCKACKSINEHLKA